MKKNGFAPVLIILLLAIVAVAGYFVFKYKTITTNIITNEYTTKGYAYDLKFKVWPKLNFSHPSDWIVNEEGSLGGNGKNAFDHITISKNGYIVIIDQRFMTGGWGFCKFKDSPTSTPLGPTLDLTTVEYKEINSNLGNLRYFKLPLGEFETPRTRDIYAFCLKNDTGYGAVDDIASITIETPLNLDNAVFTEALNIIKSIKPLQ